MRILIMVVTAILMALAAGCRQKPVTDDQAGAKHAVSDFDRLQGKWAVVKMDAGQKVEDSPPEEVTRELERMKEGRFQFDDKSLTINLPGQRGQFAFSLDESQEPKVIVLTTPDDVGPEREKLEWIYKFEGEVLVLAYMKGGKRPTEFKGRAQIEGRPDQSEVRGITVVWLKRTDEPATLDPGPSRPRKAPRGSTPPY